MAILIARKRADFQCCSCEMSRWIGFSEDDGDTLAEGANIRRQSRVVLATR